MITELGQFLRNMNTTVKNTYESTSSPIRQSRLRADRLSISVLTRSFAESPSNSKNFFAGSGPEENRKAVGESASPCSLYSSWQEVRYDIVVYYCLYVTLFTLCGFRGNTVPLKKYSERCQSRRDCF